MTAFLGFIVIVAIIMTASTFIIGIWFKEDWAGWVMLTTTFFIVAFLLIVYAIFSTLLPAS